MFLRVVLLVSVIALSLFGVAKTMNGEGIPTTATFLLLAALAGGLMYRRSQRRSFEREQRPSAPARPIYR